MEKDKVCISTIEAVTLLFMIDEVKKSRELNNLEKHIESKLYSEKAK